ncbi:NADH dehydrogenase [ubiquinone] 1 alpha subcomplex subunit 7-like [Argiope bruennichi]|uniref:NADH dehydrogenase [ubiquinone] 1 alpha subcomplex subunit 7 n=1 Tax=Argiope bruennichi TaxID=94029 RepID=A0A8T0FVC0_ARGBR|nr:NADH dehydrogenase [ubiquinone] 1 alpha subcomplex subunit 7-like [Argiope bruennichi]KAF8794696.1 NADH dehydrogenase 1 alpha like protein [Argiope bruennichi]
MAAAPRDLSPLMRWFRNLLLGREFKNSLRFQDLVSTRSPPPPKLPDGPSHKLSENYYFTRDGRHLARPPLVLLEDVKKKAITSGVKENTETKALAGKKVGQITPGNPYVWHEASENASAA